MPVLVAVTDHAVERFRQRIGGRSGEVDARPEIASRVAAAWAAGRVSETPPDGGASPARGSVYVRDVRDRSLVFVCRYDRAANEAVVITLWEREDGPIPPRVPRRFTDALRSKRDGRPPDGAGQAQFRSGCPARAPALRSVDTARTADRRQGMPFRTHLLVVANQTVDSPDLLSALEGRAAQGPIHVTLLAPVLWSEREEARARLDEACAGLREAGIEADGVLGDADPMVAVQEVWNPGRFDEIMVSTFATGASRWMQVDLPHRIAKLTDCTVRHVESRPAPEPAPTAPPPQPRGLFESAVGLLRTGTRGRAA